MQKKVANLLLHLCVTYEYSNELSKRKLHRKSWRGKFSKIDARSPEKAQSILKVENDFSVWIEKHSLLLPCPVLNALFTSCLTHASFRIFHPLCGVIRHMCHSRIAGIVISETFSRSAMTTPLKNSSHNGIDKIARTNQSATTIHDSCPY